MTPNKERMDTLVVHAGHPKTPYDQVPTGLAIYPSTSYRTDNPDMMDAILGGDAPGHTYARHGNPNVEAFSQAMASLERAPQAVSFGSGMAAVDAALYAADLRAGDRLLLSQDLYGASINLASGIWGTTGIETVFCDFTNQEVLRDVLRRKQPKALLFETLSNPLLKVVDMASVAAWAHEVGCQVIVDNTFATPLAVRPLTLGADLVVHSGTKYVGGHGDAMGGVVVGSEAYAKRLKQYLKLRGAVLGPFEAWLLHRGLKTLSVRFYRQCANALEVGRQLESSGLFSRVYHPFLPSHPTYEHARALLGEQLGGAVVTVEFPKGRKQVFQFLQALKIVGSATTIGDVYTLCLYPRIASHRNQSSEELETMGITEGTLRIAVGIEDPQDIADDVKQAYEKSLKG